MATREKVPASVERVSSSLAVCLSLAAILIAGLALRLWLSRYGVFQGDAQTFRQWAVRLVSAPLTDFYSSARSADHLPGDLWLLWGIAHLYRWFSPGMNVQGFGFLFLLKLVRSLADVGIALMVFLIARSFSGARAGLVGA